MGFLKTDYSDLGGVLPEAEYECIVSKIEVKESSSGNPMIKVELTIREDVPQEGRKAKLFDNIVQLDTMTWKFQQVAKAVGIPEGADFNTLEEFAQAIYAKPVRIKTKHREYNGEKQNSVNAWKPAQAEGGADAAGVKVDGDPFAGKGQIELGEEDLPF